MHDTPDPSIKKSKIWVYLAKVFAKSEHEVNGLVSTVQILSNDIGMEFGIKNYAVLIMKRGKVMSSEGVEMPDGERIKTVEKNGYKYLGILEYNKTKKSKMKRNFRREYLRRTKLIMKSRLNGRNKIIAIKTWTVSLMRCDASTVKWTRSELDEIDRKPRKVMPFNKELHPRRDVDRLYVSRMEGGRGLIGCKMCVKAEKNSLGWYVKHHIEPDGVIENKVYKILWGFASKVIPKLKLDKQILLLLIKPRRKLRDERVKERKVWKVQKYKVLNDKIARICGMKEVIVIPVVAGADSLRPLATGCCPL